MKWISEDNRTPGKFMGDSTYPGGNRPTQPLLDGLRRIMDAVERGKVVTAVVLHGHEAAALWNEMDRLYHAAGERNPVGSR